MAQGGAVSDRPGRLQSAHPRGVKNVQRELADPVAGAAFVGLADGGGEVGEVAAVISSGGGGAGAVWGAEIGLDVDGASEQIEVDGIAIANGGDGAADGGFG